MKKQASAKSLKGIGIIMIFLFWPVGIVLLVKAGKRRQEEQAEEKRKEEQAEKRKVVESTDNVDKNPEISVLERIYVREISADSHEYEYKGVDVYVPEESISYLECIKRKDEITLELEPENDYDPCAVAVYHYSVHVGYLYRGKLKDMVYDFLSREDTVEAHVSSVTEEYLKINLFLSR